MKKKVLALALTAALTLSMGMTAFAGSSSTGDNSGDQPETTAPSTPAPAADGKTVEAAAPGEKVAPATVKVNVVAADGTVSSTNLAAYTAEVEKSVTTTIAQVAASAPATGASAGAAVSAMMTTPATPMFQATIDALGGKAAINNCGTKKTAAVAKDAFGNVIASAGTVKGVTSGSLVMLMSVNADGTVEFVEGVVDPVTGQILGAFKGTPKTITVMVFIPADLK